MEDYLSFNEAFFNFIIEPYFQIGIGQKRLENMQEFCKCQHRSVIMKQHNYLDEQLDSPLKVDKNELRAIDDRSILLEFEKDENVSLDIKEDDDKTEFELFHSDDEEMEDSTVQ